MKEQGSKRKLEYLIDKYGLNKRIINGVNYVFEELTTCTLGKYSNVQCNAFWHFKDPNSEKCFYDLDNKILGCPLSDSKRKFSITYEIDDDGILVIEVKVENQQITLIKESLI